jgi:hypothetical protein
MTKALRLVSLAAVLAMGMAPATMAASNDINGEAGATPKPTTSTQPTTRPGTVVAPRASGNQQQTAHSTGQPNLALPGAGTGKGPSTDSGGSTGGSKP